MTALLPLRRVSTPSGGRDLPEEVAVALVYNGTTHAVMMATPAAIADLALGFTISEGIASAEEAGEVEVVEHDLGIEARLWLPAHREAALAARRRALVGAVGCGLCGIDSLEAATRALPRLPDGGPVLTRAAVQAALDALRAHQPLHDATRAVHAAGLWGGGGRMPTLRDAAGVGDVGAGPLPALRDVDTGRGGDVGGGQIAHPTGRILLAREDVGRHNALDKLIGAAARAGIQPGTVAITSRLSVEIVQKTVMAGARILLSVSAPTAHAVRLAEAANLTLASTAGGLTLYTGTERIA